MNAFVHTSIDKSSGGITSDTIVNLPRTADKMKFKKKCDDCRSLKRVYRLKFFTGRIFENLVFRVLQFGNSVSPAVSR